MPLCPRRRVTVSLRDFGFNRALHRSLAKRNHPRAYSISPNRASIVCIQITAFAVAAVAPQPIP